LWRHDELLLIPHLCGQAGRYALARPATVIASEAKNGHTKEEKARSRLEGAGMTNEACPTIISDIHQMQSTIQHM
jgi:hypothetical protein